MLHNQRPGIWTAIALAGALWADIAVVHAADFYQGKEITIIVGFPAGGGTYDMTARLFGHHLGRHLPGRPSVIVRNRPGAGSMVATMHLADNAPKDGTALAVIGGGTVIEPLLGNAQAKYDPRRLNWIGGRTRDNFLCVVWHTVPVNTIADVMKRETIIGSTGPGSRTYTYPRAFNEIVGTKFKVVSGYPAGTDITIALERGEVEGYCGWSLDSMKARVPDWIRDRRLKSLAQFTLGKSGLAGIPIARDIPDTEKGRQAIEILSADAVLAWPLVAPPDLPVARVTELRRAFDAMSRDPQYLAEAAALKLDVDAVPGEEMQALVDRLYQTPPDVIEVVQKINAAQ